MRKASCSLASPKSASSSTCPRAHSTESTDAAAVPESARLASAIGDPALREVVRRELDRHGVALQNPDVMLAHLPGNVRGDDMAVRELDAKSRVRQRVHYRAFHLYRFFFGHCVSWRPIWARHCCISSATAANARRLARLQAHSCRKLATGLRIPARRFTGRLAIFIEQGEKVRARHRRRAETRDVRGSNLTVDERKIARLQVLGQPHERDLRRIGRAREHRLAEEYPADRDPVEPADELFAPPALERMRPAE